MHETEFQGGLPAGRVTHKLEVHWFLANFIDVEFETEALGDDFDDDLGHLRAIDQNLGSLLPAEEVLHLHLQLQQPVEVREQPVYSHNSKIKHRVGVEHRPHNLHKVLFRLYFLLIAFGQCFEQLNNFGLFEVGHKIRRDIREHMNVEPVTIEALEHALPFGFV